MIRCPNLAVSVLLPTKRNVKNRGKETGKRYFDIIKIHGIMKEKENLSFHQPKPGEERENYITWTNERNRLF